VGGGTGLSTLLRGLKQYVRRPQEDGRYPIADLVALVTVTDDGGSSGRLRRDYSILPPGDIRNCMVALSDDEALMIHLFRYRFDAGRGLRGHSFGNLFLTALTSVTGDFADAVRLSGQVLAIRGRIFPATTKNISLEAVMEDGRVVHGETRIAKARGRIARVRLSPGRAKPLPEALEAIKHANLIILGPGSLYTSVIPNLLISGVADAIAKSSAARVYINNLMTQPGETSGYTAADHVRAIYKHTGKRIIDWVLVNRQKPSPNLTRRYRVQGAEPVQVDVQELQRLGVRCVFDDLLDEHSVVRHNPARLARFLIEEFIEHRPPR
jgi:uncharacterized cofD-like protein